MQIARQPVLITQQQFVAPAVVVEHEQADQGIALCDQLLVEPPVLLTVHRLLADESGDSFLEHRIGHLIGEAAHRPDEPLLAGREYRRQQRGQVAEHDVALDEVTLHRLRVAEAEPDATHRGIRSGGNAFDCRPLYSTHDDLLLGYFRWSTRTPSEPKSSSRHCSKSAVVSMSSGWKPGRRYFASWPIKPLKNGPR